MQTLHSEEVGAVSGGTQNLAAAVIGGAELGAEIGTVAAPGIGTAFGAFAGAGLGFIGWCALAGAGVIEA